MKTKPLAFARMAVNMKKTGKPTMDLAKPTQKLVGTSEELGVIWGIENKDAINLTLESIKRLAKTKDVQGFLEDCAPKMALELVNLALTGENEKIKLEAIKDMLDRAGHGKITKTANINIDASQSKEALISFIKGARKELNEEGIEIVEDPEDK